MPVFSVGATREDVDTRAIEIYRSGLQSTVAEMQLDTDARRILTARDKDRVRNAWGSFLDYMLALDSIGAYHRQQKGAASVAITYSAFLAQYRSALEMIEAADKLPGADEVLNERMTQIGLVAGSYSRVKFRFLNVARATEFAALDSLNFHTDTSLVCSEVIYKAYEGSVRLPLTPMLNRINTPPNEIVREFDATYGTPAQQFDFVLFLDGHELQRAAVPGTLDDFRKSWRRPKWHTVTQ